MSRIALLILAIVSSYFALIRPICLWGPSGYFEGGFGITVDPTTARVTHLYPRNWLQGIRDGDQVDFAAMPFSERAYFYEDMAPPPGVAMKIKTTRAGTERFTTVRTVPGNYDYDDVFAVFGDTIIAMAYIFTAILVVWSRPNVMLWGLAVFLMSAHWFPFYLGSLRSPPIAALIIFAFALVQAIGLPGLIVFSARFPDNRTTASTRYWYSFAVACFLVYVLMDIYPYVPLFTAHPIAAPPSLLYRALSTTVSCLILAGLCWKALRLKARSQWNGFRWLVAGYGVGIVLGWYGANLWFRIVPMSTNWPEFGEEVLRLAFPASVIYAMIRHRAFDLGYLANRTIVYGAFAFVAVSTIVISLWVASQLSSSVGIGLAMFVALLVGMTFRSSRAFVVRFVDRTFLRRRYEVAQSLDALRDSLRGSNDANRMTDDIATTLGLSSLAVFSRAADGGFVRNAAFGWPPGAAWHLLPDEPLTRTLDDGGSGIVRVLDDEDEVALPLADARPRFALAVRRGERVERAIFVGQQRNGASLDRDAMRWLQSLFDEARVA